MPAMTLREGGTPVFTTVKPEEKMKAMPDSRKMQ